MPSREESLLGHCDCQVSLLCLSVLLTHRDLTCSASLQVCREGHGDPGRPQQLRVDREASGCRLLCVHTPRDSCSVIKWLPGDAHPRCAIHTADASPRRAPGQRVWGRSLLAGAVLASAVWDCVPALSQLPGD